MTPPTEVQYKDLIELSTHIQDIIKGMTWMGERVKALEAANIEIYGCLKGLKECEQGLVTGLQESFRLIKSQQTRILALEQTVMKQLNRQLADAQEANRP